MVSVRRGARFFERVHWGKHGQDRQSLLENFILMTSLVRWSIAGVQLMLVFPAGQVAC